MLIEMSQFVADGWLTSWYPISIGWITMEREYDLERPKTTNELEYNYLVQHPTATL